MLLSIITFTHGTGWTPAAIGTYQIDIWASNINGNTDMNNSNDVASGSVDVFNSSTQRTPLLELTGQPVDHVAATPI